jgi:hypothetical protein
LGLSGRVPRRVDAATNTALLDLIDRAIKDGWSHRAACQTLELRETRAWRWRTRRTVDRLVDRPAGGNPVHGLRPEEEAEIVALFDEWGQTDRSRAQAGSPRLVSRPGMGVPVLRPPCSGCSWAHAATSEAVGDLCPHAVPRLVTYAKHSIWVYDTTHFAGL